MKFQATIYVSVPVILTVEADNLDGAEQKLNDDDYQTEVVDDTLEFLRRDRRHYVREASLEAVEEDVSA